MANEHSGHRQRMKNRYLDHGLDTFEVHEVLEIVLYYAIPRKDTNPIAHNLIGKFGTFSSVFDAPLESLTKAGISEGAATFVKLVPDLLNMYMDDRYNNKGKIIELTQLPERFIKIFHNKMTEQVYLVLMDSKHKELYCGVVSEGTATNANIDISKICELAVRYSSRYAVIAHNHPSGISLPSRADIKVTMRLYQALRLLNVELRDHYVIAQDDCVSMDDAKVFFRSELEYLESGFSDVEIDFIPDENKPSSENISVVPEQVDILKHALHYAIPKKDTEIIALDLLKKFGSISSVFDAPYELLIKSGLTDNAATFIKLMPDLLSVYMDDKYNKENKVLNVDNLANKFINKYLGKNIEMVYLLLLDGKYREIYCGIVSKGSITNADVNIPKICELAIRHSAKFAIIAHNHPSGICLPSQADIRVTTRLYQALKVLRVELLDHYIVAEDDCVSLYDAKSFFKTEQEYIESGYAKLGLDFK